MATDYGTCISVTDDLPLRWKMATGARVLAEACYRRWSTDRGSLPYDLDYGTNVRDMIGATMSRAEVSTWQTRIANEALKDERVADCTVAIVYDAAAASAEITATITPSSAASFRLVVAVSSVTVELLRIE